MSVATHDAGSWPTAASILRALLRAARTALEAHARYRVNSAVSPSQFLQSERDIRRCRRLMQAGN
jgi:hypothetical protein